MPRRGENIRQRKDGRWEARYIKSYSEDGKAKYASVYGKGYYEVKKKLNDITEKTRRDEIHPVKDLSFREVLFLWLSNTKIKLKTQTYARYLEYIENHIIPYIGRYKISRIDAPLINIFLEQKSENGRLDGTGGLSPGTIKTIIYIIQSAIGFAVDAKFRPPLIGTINRPAARKKELEVLNKYEQKKLESYVTSESDPAKLGILICLHIGLRIGEICGLRWSDIDFEEQTICIRRTIIRVRNVETKTGEPKTTLVVGEPKTSSSYRVVPIPSYLSETIKKMRELSKSIYVLEGVTYEFLDPRTYQYRFQKYLADCHIRSLNFHTLRHTFATRCIEVGMDIKTLSEILGHASVNITLNTYVHSSMELKRNQLEMLGTIRGQ